MAQNTQKARTVTVVGAGSSGQAIAGFLGMNGYDVRLWNRDDAGEVQKWVQPISDRGGLQVEGKVEGFGPVQLVTTDLASAIEGADVIIVNTTADAYQEVGRLLAPHLTAGQPLILKAAGTLGSIDMLQGLAAGGFTDEIVIGETAGTVFGSRNVGPALVNIAGQKKNVAISTVPQGHEAELSALVPELGLVVGEDILSSGFNNTGPSLHVVPMVLNAGWTEAHGGDFLYYAEGVTPGVAAVMEQFDQERLAVARAFGYSPASLSEYLVRSLGAPEGPLHETIHGVAMYAAMPSPPTLDHRFLWEDALAGVVPVLALAEIAGVEAPVHRSLITLAGSLLGRDLMAEGRTTRNLSLDGYTAEDMKALVNDTGTLSDWKQRAASAAVAA